MPFRPDKVALAIDLKAQRKYHPEGAYYCDRCDQHWDTIGGMPYCEPKCKSCKGLKVEHTEDGHCLFAPTKWL